MLELISVLAAVMDSDYNYEFPNTNIGMVPS